jgi:hypothetical protein
VIAAMSEDQLTIARERLREARTRTAAAEQAYVQALLVERGARAALEACHLQA